MSNLKLTRADNSTVVVNLDQIACFAALPVIGRLHGLLEIGTRIEFHNGTHQEVKETADVIRKALRRGA